MIVRCIFCDAANRVPAARAHERAKCGQCKAVVGPPSRALSIHSASEFDELITQAKVPVVIDFWAPWCGPCHALAPQIEALAARTAGTAIVAKVDTDELKELAGRYAIRSIPTMILFSDGREQRRARGAMPADAIADSLQI